MTSRPPIKCPIVRMRLLPKPDFRHLAVFAGVWKGFRRAADLRKCGLCAFPQPLRPTSHAAGAGVRSVPGRGGGFLRRRISSPARFAGAARSSTASRPAPRISSENSPLPATRAITSVPIMVAIAAIACLRAALRGSVRNLFGEHVDHLFQLGREGLAGPRAFAGDFGAQRRNGAAMAGIVAMHRRQIGFDDRRQPLFRRRSASANLRQRSVERSIA